MRKSRIFMLMCVFVFMAMGFVPEAAANSYYFTFEGMQPSPVYPATVPMSTVTSPGYTDFTWSPSIQAIQGSQYVPGSGYQRNTAGYVSITGSAAPGNPAQMDTMTIKANSGNFNYISANIFSAWNTGQTVTIEGFNSGSGGPAVFSISQLVDYTHSSFFEWSGGGGVDTITFSTSGGTTGGGSGGSGVFMGIDNLKMVVPEPSSMLIILLGLGGIVGLGRRFSSKTDNPVASIQWSDWRGSKDRV